MRGFFEGRARFIVDGCDHSLLNRLRMYAVRDVVQDERVNQLRFTVSLRHVPQVKLVLSRQKYSVSVNKNLLQVLNVFYARPALIIAAVTCIAAFFVLNGFIFNVKIVGVEGEQHDEVMAFVQKQGVRPLMHKTDQKADLVVSAVIRNFDYVAHASAKLDGSTFIIYVYSVTVPDGDTHNRDIIATSDGVVTNLVVASGRAMVRVGDAVRTGQVLVKGERQIGAIDVGRDEFGKLIQEGIFVPSRAVAEVFADVKYSEYGNATADELLAKIILKSGIKAFDKVETFPSQTGGLEVVVTINKSITM